MEQVAAGQAKVGRSPAGQAEVGRQGSGGVWRGGAGLTGAGPRRAKAGGTGKRTWTSLWGATQADKMVRLGRALGSVLLLEVLRWDRLKKVGAHPEPTARRN